MTDLHLVGSIPLDSVEQVFRTFGAKLGPNLVAMPDGEIGPRRHWISRVHYQVFAGHPQLEILRRPAPEDGVERLNPRGPGDSWQFRVKDGVERVAFGDPGWRLGFARDAINSYFVFKTLRAEGALPATLRFQVSIPTVNSILPPRIFPDVNDLDKMKPGLEAALSAELRTIVDRIAPSELAFQWDCATELQDAYGGIDVFPPAQFHDRNAGQFHRLSAIVPEDALVGFHLCFGTLGGWPRFEPDDLSGAVTLANLIVESADRPVDWLHIPTLNRTEERFFAPLADLRPGATRIYLGLIHNMDTYRTRLEIARRYLDTFGVGAYCGFGRHASDELPGLLNDHLAAADADKGHTGQPA